MTHFSQEQARIVVGVDGSAHSHRALRWALTQASLTGAAVEVVACWHRSAMITAFVPMAYASLDLTDGTREATRDAVDKAVIDVPGGADLDVQISVIEGYPALVLVEKALGAALLVVGSRGHGELSGVALGSVGLHCATHARCPVLILHDQELVGAQS